MTCERDLVPHVASKFRVSWALEDEMPSIRGRNSSAFFSKTHQQKYIAYFFDADSKNHIYFVQK